MAEAALRDDGYFMQRLGKFPNLFLQDFIDRRSKERYNISLMELEKTRESCPQEQREEEDDHVSYSDSRIVVFFRWMSGQDCRAKELALQEVEERPDDLVACTSLAFILYRKDDEDKAYEQLRRLEALRRDDAPKFAKLEMEAQPLIRRLYTNFCLETEPYELSDRMEAMLAARPDDVEIKFDLALIMRRYISRPYEKQHPHADFSRAVKRTIELLADIKDGREHSARIRGLAAANLGSIIGWHHNERIRQVAGRESRRLHLDARRCFEEALDLFPDSHSICQLAGKFFRNGDPHRSKELLERALSLRPSSANHHCLGLTYQRMAMMKQHRRGSAPFRRDDPNVRKALEHFRKAIEITGGVNTYAQNDLDKLEQALDEQRR